MLAEYKEEICNVEEVGEYARLWKYFPILDFNEKETRRGIKYYEKKVLLTEISSLFSVSFFCTIENRKFFIRNFWNNKVDIICDNAKYANEHNFVEVERGVWTERKSVDELDNFCMVRKDKGSDERTSINLTREEFIEAWKKYVSEVNPKW